MKRHVLRALACFLVLSKASHAQPKAGPEFLGNPTFGTNLDQRSPAVSFNPTTGQFVVAWDDNYNSWGQRFSADGMRLGDALEVCGGCRGPSIAALAPGGSVELGIDKATGTSINGSRYSASGSPLSFFRLNTFTTGMKSSARLASDANGNFVAVWSSTVGDGDGYGVFARRFLYSGEPAGLVNESPVNVTTAGDQRGSAVAMTPAGAFVVVWQSAPIPAGTCCAHIFARRYGSDGTPVTSEFQVDTTTSVGNYFPDVASDTAGNFVVVWTAYNQYGNYSYNIKGRRYSSGGSPIGGEFRANSYTNLTMGLPKVAQPDSDFVITWQELQADGSGNAVMARRYLPNGVAIGAPFVVNSYTQGDQSTPAISSRPSGPYVVVWTSSQIPGSMRDIFGQRFCLNGDVNGDGHVDVTDVFYLINALFTGGVPPLGCSDANGSSTLDVADVFYLVNFLFAGGPAPV